MLGVSDVVVGGAIGFGSSLLILIATQVAEAFGRRAARTERRQEVIRQDRREAYRLILQALTENRHWANQLHTWPVEWDIDMSYREDADPPATNIDTEVLFQMHSSDEVAKSVQAALTSLVAVKLCLNKLRNAEVFQDPAEERQGLTTALLDQVSHFQDLVEESARLIAAEMQHLG